MFSSYYMDRHGHVYPNQLNDDDVRVAVISPEDREQAERLDAAIAAAYSDAPLGVDRATPMQAALREFANPTTPPKPEEPTGLGAVVEDAEGRRWVRTENVPCWYATGFGIEFWDRIAAVRVLSEGVTQ